MPESDFYDQWKQDLIIYTRWTPEELQRSLKFKRTWVAGHIAKVTEQAYTQASQPAVAQVGPSVDSACIQLER